jgi:hypothetical protein
VNLRLDALEQMTNPATRQLVEQLLQDDAVKVLRKQAAGHWSAEVDGHLTSVRISRSVIRSTSCSCPAFSQQQRCSHVLALAWSVRHALSSKPATAAKQAAEHIRVEDVLAIVSPEELKAFLLQFARRQPAFAAAIRTRFAPLVEVPDSRLKYQRLLEEQLLAARKRDGNFHLHALRSFLQATNTLLGAAQDTLILQHFRETWSILSALTDTLLPVLRKINDQTDHRFDPVIRRTFGLISDLAATPSLPPQLKEELWAFLLALTGKPSISLNQLTLYLLQCQALFLQDPACLRDWQSAICAELSRPALPEAHLLTLRFHYFKWSGVPPETEEHPVWQEFLQSVPAMEALIKGAAHDGQAAAILPLLRQAVHKPALAEIRLQMLVCLFELTLATPSVDEAVRWATELLQETGPGTWLVSAQETLGDRWRRFVEDLLEELFRQPRDSKRQDAIASLLVLTKEYDRLLRLLAEENELSLLLKHDREVLRIFPERMTTIYTDYFRSYLAHHLGPQPAKKLAMALAHLRSAGADRIAANLLANLREAFPGRRILLPTMEEDDGPARSR